jgi:hypothetical protein
MASAKVGRGLISASESVARCFDGLTATCTRFAIEAGVGIAAGAVCLNTAGLGCAVFTGAVSGAVGGLLGCPTGASLMGCAAQGAVVGGASAGVMHGAFQAFGALRSSGIGRGLRRGTIELETEIASTERTAIACLTHSFAAATLVVMADGSTKGIEAVEVGDVVRATDPATDTTTSRVVTKTHRHADTELTDLAVKDADGTTAVIHTTIHHRFWSTTRGAWIDASELREGEHLRSDDGEVLAVAGVRSFTGEAWMYDLTVDEVHSYYVVAGDDGVLVHNCGGEIAEGAQAAANSAASFARLTKHLEFDEAASVFTKSGGLQPSVIQDARLITPGARIGNPEVIKTLTADGSNMADWGKYATQTFQSPSGPFQAHFYRNGVTGAANYSIDYKVLFGSLR